MEDEEIVRSIVQENSEGLERLAREEPAAERRSRVRRFKRKLMDLIGRDSDRVVRITA